MNKNNINNSKSDNDKIFLSYAAIIKEYDVQIVSLFEYTKLTKEEKGQVFVMLITKRNNVPPPDPTKPPVWFSYWVDTVFVPKINNIEQKIPKLIKKAIHDLAVKNNLKE